MVAISQAGAHNKGGCGDGKYLFCEGSVDIWADRMTWQVVTIV